MDNLNSPFVSLTGMPVELRRTKPLLSPNLSPGGLRHERLGRASRGSCPALCKHLSRDGKALSSFAGRAGQEVFTTFVALAVPSANLCPQTRNDEPGLGQVIGSAPILFTSLTGIAKASLICSPSRCCSNVPRQVCMAGMLGGVVSVPVPQEMCCLHGLCYSGQLAPRSDSVLQGLDPAHGLQFLHPSTCEHRSLWKSYDSYDAFQNLFGILTPAWNAPLCKSRSPARLLRLLLYCCFPVGTLGLFAF